MPHPLGFSQSYLGGHTILLVTIFQIHQIPGPMQIYLLKMIRDSLHDDFKCVRIMEISKLQRYLKLLR